MKWNLAGLVTVFALGVHTAPPADACGVKLTIKSSAPRKAVARTSNPSEVLLLGTPPHRLERDLSAAGHHVEVAAKPANAKRKAYTIVIVDSSLQEEARSNFGGSIVIVRSDDVGADIRTVENQVARKPTRVAEARVAIDAKAQRQPIRTGGSGARVVGAGGSGEGEITPPIVAVKVEPKVEPKAVVVAVVDPKPVEPKVVEPKVEPKVVEPKARVEPKVVEPKPVAKPKAGTIDEEVYFTVGNTKSDANAYLAKAVRYLTDNADVQIIVEGYADPSGTPDINMAIAQKRAEWVRDYLVSAGIDASRLEVISYGDTKLKYSAADRRNRRVALVRK